MKRLTLLVGPQGSGKTTYCAERFSGHMRISQDEMGKDGHREAFRDAINRGDESIIIDRTNSTRFQRSNYISLAKKNGYKTKIVWLNVDKNTCLQRIAGRKSHPTVTSEGAADALQWYFNSFQVPSKLEVDEVEIVGDPPIFSPVKDICTEIGDRRFLIVGDIHGCLDELLQMLEERSFDLKDDVLITCGDIVDRGPKIRETIEFVMTLPRFYSVMGNHEHKCIRHFQREKTKISHSLQATIESFDNCMPQATLDFLKSLPPIIKIPAGYVVHGGFDPLMHPEEQSWKDCIYMRYYGGKSYFDSDFGIMWHKLWPRDWPKVFYGHTPEISGASIPNVVSLDGGCVFGDYLKAWDSKDGIVHYVNAKMAYNSYKIGSAAPAAGPNTRSNA